MNLAAFSRAELLNAPCLLQTVLTWWTSCLLWFWLLISSLALQAIQTTIITTTIITSKSHPVLVTGPYFEVNVFSNNDNNNNANTNMFMIMIMNSNTNNVGGRKFSPGGRNDPLKPPLKSKKPMSIYEEAVDCGLKWLTWITWKWAEEAKTWPIRALSLLLAFNLKTNKSMSSYELQRFLTTPYANYETSPICNAIRNGMSKSILKS